PGIAGVVDICKCQAVYTCLCGCFYQFFSRKASVTEAEICFTVQIHRSSCLAYGSKCAGRSNQVHAKAVAYAVYGLGKFYHFLAVVEQRYLIVARNKMGKPYANKPYQHSLVVQLVKQLHHMRFNGFVNTGIGYFYLLCNSVEIGIPEFHYHT